MLEIQLPDGKKAWVNHADVDEQAGKLGKVLVGGSETFVVAPPSPFSMGCRVLQQVKHAMKLGSPKPISCDLSGCCRREPPGLKTTKRTKQPQTYMYTI